MGALGKTAGVRVSRATPLGLFRRYASWPAANRAPCALSCVILSQDVRSMSRSPLSRLAASLRQFTHVVAASEMGGILTVQMRPTAGFRSVFPRTSYGALPVLGRESDHLGESVTWANQSLGRFRFRVQGVSEGDARPPPSAAGIA